MAGNVPSQDPMDFPLSQPLDIDQGVLLIQCLWQRTASHKDTNKYQSYLSYYGDEMRRLQFSTLNELRPLATQTHADLINVITILSQHRQCSLSNVRDQLCALFPRSSEEAIQNSIDLALRTWLTLNVRNNKNLHTGVPSIHWESDSEYKPFLVSDVMLPKISTPSICNFTNLKIIISKILGSSLVEFVAQIFTPNNLVQIDPAERQLDENFTAAYLRRACSVRIEWTTCIADHLRYHVWEGARVVQIYHMKQCAFDHMNGSGTSLYAIGTVYPTSVLQEVVWSLNQLFPADEKHTQHLLNWSNKTFNRDGPFNRHRPTDLHEYQHFREKLFELRRVFMAAPGNFSEMMHNRQNYQTKFQVILAIVLGFVLATIFGVIASVTAIISAKAAIQAFHLAQHAYDLQKQVPICSCSP